MPQPGLSLPRQDLREKTITPNEARLTKWVIVTNQRTGQKFPALMHPEETGLIMAEWAQVPEDVLTQWASESVPEALHVISER